VAPVSDQAVTAARLLDAHQVGERWGVKHTMVLRLARTGRLPVVKLGRYRRFRLEDIEEFEANGGTDDE
jgi:excisionase family DNA binding protein